jgi:hypothetical protein
MVANALYVEKSEMPNMKLQRIAEYAQNAEVFSKTDMTGRRIAKSVQNAAKQLRINIPG